MNIVLYVNESEINAVDKNITELTELTGTLREQSSIIDPIITLSDIDNHVGKMNYAYIPQFNRYYFINNIKSVNNNLWELSCHVDVLQSFAAEIRAQSGIVERQENYFNLYLNDGNTFQVYQNPQIATIKFPAGFTDPCFIIAIAGS